MWTYLSTFLAVFVTDMIYIMYVKSVQADRPWAAAWWSVVVTFTASVAVINYTEDHWALIPALIGAFLGALAGMLFRDRKSVV